jgi:hypothetical protein
MSNIRSDSYDLNLIREDNDIHPSYLIKGWTSGLFKLFLQAEEKLQTKIDFKGD